MNWARQVLVPFAVAILSIGASAQSAAQMQYEGIKFHVHNTQRPGTVRLYRLLLSDGSHLYTTSESEVKELIASETYRATIEPMDAYVYEETAPKTNRLYRFTIKLPNNFDRHFYTATEHEMRDVLKEQPQTELHSMKSFVFPHTYVPAPDEGIMPVYWFYNPQSGEHFYTTSEEDKRYLIALAEEEKLCIAAQTAVLSHMAGGQTQFHGVKFHVHKTEQPGTVRLYRLLLSDGSHWYTTSPSEVKSLMRSKKQRATIEPMNAFVYKQQAPNTVRLYRFTIIDEGLPPRYFNTAFDVEMKQNNQLPQFRPHPMKAFVFPHIFQPEANSDIIPLYVFFNPQLRENFYTTSEDEKLQLIKQIEDENRLKLEVIAERFRKFRKRAPVGVALRDNPLMVGEIEWKVSEVRDLGNVIKSGNQFIPDLQTAGKFLWIEVRVENKGQDLKTLVAPNLFDDQGRAFISSSEAHFHIPKEKNISLLKNLNPNLPFTAVFIYEVPADAAKLTLLAGDLDLLTTNEGAIDLGF